MSEQRPLQTPGEMLAGGRQRLTSTLEEVAASTKIPIHILQAIELDEYNKLSGPLYIKSFLRTYAEHVGLDPDAVLGVYQQLAGAGESQTSAQEEVWAEEVRVQRIGLPWGRIVLYVVIAASLVAGGLLLLVRGCQVREPEGRDEISVQETGRPVEEPSPAGSAEDAAASRPVAADAATGDAAGPAETPAQEDSPGERSTRPAVQLPDTLALGWLEGRDPVVSPPEPSPSRRRSGQSPAVAPGRAPEPEVPVSRPEAVTFADGQSWPVVLRLECQQPVGVAVQRDAERDFRIVYWPAEPRPLPDGGAGLDQGTPYRVAGGLVVYWGARDHFIMRLDRTEGVKVAVNGQQQNVGAWSPGDEMLLDDRTRVSGPTD